MPDSEQRDMVSGHSLWAVAMAAKWMTPPVEDWTGRMLATAGEGEGVEGQAPALPSSSSADGQRRAAQGA